MKISNKKIVFLLIGVLTFLIYYLLLFFFFGLLEVYYPISIAISYLLAVLFHFYCNRMFTFDGSNGKLRGQVGRYALLSVVSYMIQTALIVLFYDHMNIHFYFSAFIAALVCAVITYIVMNQWVFRKVVP